MRDCLLMGTSRLCVEYRNFGSHNETKILPQPAHNHKNKDFLGVWETRLVSVTIEQHSLCETMKSVMGHRS